MKHKNLTKAKRWRIKRGSSWRSEGDFIVGVGKELVTSLEPANTTFLLYLIGSFVFYVSVGIGRNVGSFHGLLELGHYHRQPCIGNG